MPVTEHPDLMSLAPDSPMGELLRRQWIPFLPARLLEDKPVQPVRLLGEGLVCYRDRAGTIGLIGEFCGHQLVNLMWGYPDDRGLRCCYHDWCYDETGQCTEMPLSYNSRIEDERLVAYPVRAHDGLLFAYLGPTPTPAVEGPAIPCSGFEVADVCYSVVGEHWLHALAAEVALAEARKLEPRMVAPNVLVLRDAEGVTRFVAEVPVDEATTLRLTCAVRGDVGPDVGPIEPSSLTEAPAASEADDYWNAIELAGATARAYPREAPACGCAGQTWAEQYHELLLRDFRAGVPASG